MLATISIPIKLLVVIQTFYTCLCCIPTDRLIATMTNSNRALLIYGSWKGHMGVIITGINDRAELDHFN